MKLSAQSVGIHACSILLLLALSGSGKPPETSAGIEVDPDTVTGRISPYFFGQFIEHEHNTIQGGLWAELLRDRKFEQGDDDGDGVSNGWAPEERIQDRYWELQHGRGINVRYFIDRQNYYGGGASQAVDLHGPGPRHASVYQIGLQVAKGHRYVFYVFLKRRGSGKAFVELDKLRGPVYGHRQFGDISDQWQKYTAEFTSPEDTDKARLRIAVEGEGTFWMDSASLMPADNLQGMRRDVIDAMRPMRIPLMRYPGGCFADYYHWENGIGDRDKRPEVYSPAWREWDPNDFGIDEFVALAGELHFEPHLTVNYVSGTPAEAARWVEYVNSAPDRGMGHLRAANGHSQPYGFKFWAVGNEAPDLCSSEYTGNTELNVYVKRYGEYKAAMQGADSSIHLMASSVGDLNWIHNLLNAMPVDVLATSIYTGEWSLHPDETRICDLDHYYRKVVSEPLEVNRKIEENIRSIGDRFPHSARFLAISEINSWWLSERVDPDYRLANALYFSGVFNVLLRRADQIFTAEASTTLNVQGLIEINPVAIKLTPPYFAYVLYANHIGDRVVSCRTRSPNVTFDPGLPSLDAAATISDDGKTLFLAVVNRDERDAISSGIDLKTWRVKLAQRFRAFELDGNDRDAANPYGSVENVSIQEKNVVVERLPLTYRFPPHSVTVLQFNAAG
ncbi:MAG: alpha-L-arabinofuranosidase C-terminal domain-containing protein [Bryobacteraceae bacterium]